MVKFVDERIGVFEMSTEITIVKDGLNLHFFSLDQHEEFFETDCYFLFLHVDIKDGGNGSWHLFEIFHDGEEMAEFASDVDSNDSSHHKWLAYHNQKIAWTNGIGIGKNDNRCPECGSEKVQYLGLGVGSSTAEMVCPKC